MIHKNNPGLFGVTHSNRDFSRAEYWGKNQFNSSFPVALANFLFFKKLDVVYICLNNHLEVFHKKLSTKDLYGIAPDCDDIFFSFESQYAPYQQMILGNIPRVDLVTQSRSTGQCLRPLEIKLTALPDHTTCDLAENEYGCELVIRPDTIVYLACSLMGNFLYKRELLKKLLENSGGCIKDWADAEQVLPHIQHMVRSLENVALAVVNQQKPLVMQPVWKTNGKTPILSMHCLDVFVWSDLAFIKLFMDAVKEDFCAKKITRQARTVIWLYKMLLNFSEKGQMNHHGIIDELSYNTKNDKAFSVAGATTHAYMACAELERPRIKRTEIKHIILGGGQHMLSPERRFDAIIFNSKEIFG